MNKQEIEFLKDLQHELNTQDHVSQASPRFWVIVDYRWELAAPGCNDSYRVFDVEGNEWSLVQFMEYVKNNNEYNDDVRHAEGIYGDNIYDVVEVLMDLRNFKDFDMYPVTHESYIVPNTMFLTNREAKEHIKSNQHHYTSKAHSYAMTAWRSPQVEKLMNILENTNFTKIETEVIDNDK